MLNQSAPRIFSKKLSSIDDLIVLLRTRGLLISDEQHARHHLARIGYYRLSGYMLPFQIMGQGTAQHHFKSGVDFLQIIDAYDFDRGLRLAIINGLERIEVAVRCAVSDTMSLKYGPHWYTDKSLFDPKADHQAIVSKIQKDIAHDGIDSSKRDIFIDHYYKNYDQPEMPPCWMVFETMSFGTVSHILNKLQTSSRNAIAKCFNLPEPALTSWCHSLSYLRNLCAHHSRVWNRKFTIKPFVARQYEGDLNPNTQVYAQLVTIQILLKTVSPKSNFVSDLQVLFQNHPSIKPDRLGFKPDWQNRIVWK